MKRSLRYRLLRGFLLFSLLAILIVIPMMMQYFKEKQQVTDFISFLEKTHIFYLQKLKNQQDFLAKDRTNSLFFLTHTSFFLKNSRQLQDSLSQNLKEIRSSQYPEELGVQAEVKEALRLFHKQDSLFQVIVAKVTRRGFKDYGLVGAMRENVHQLEDYPELDQRKVLQLRRHEKDFIIRHRKEYIQKHQQLGREFLKDISRNSRLEQAEKDSVLKYLRSYLDLFQKVTRLDYEMRYGANSLTDRFRNTSGQFEVTFDTMIEKTKAQRTRIFSQLQYYYILFVVALILLSIASSYYLSKRITRPIINLKNQIERFVASDFRAPVTVSNKGPDDEIRSLYRSFNHMIAQLKKRQKERDVAVRALRHGETKFRELSDLLPQAVFEVDNDFDFTYVNKTFEQQFTCSRKQAINGLSLADFVINVDTDFYKRLRNGESVEVYLRRHDNSTFNGLITVSKIYDMDEVRGFRGVIVDISKRIKRMK